MNEDRSEQGTTISAGVAHSARRTPPQIPDRQVLRHIAGASYGNVWLARNVIGTYRAIKIVYRRTFNSERPYEREFTGIEKFEPISRSDGRGSRSNCVECSGFIRVIRVIRGFELQFSRSQYG